MASRKTKKDYWDEILAIKEVRENNELKEFAQNEIKRLEKCSNSKKAKEDDELRTRLIKGILEGMEKDKKYRVIDLINSIDTLAGFSPQRITPICKRLVEEGRLKMIEEKRANYYALPMEEVA